ncbi:hypothetical protein BofuT4_P046750.1 [Botrytis cinerea T4]|uniref:Uncharacterized protein n=1 Tax=Botryotinia fuckeliana (strain T4) TaxID=999810 RepID=G2XYX0_BOTF4|nr:hypothetical protein BofuT4_P046750.1 [Botrytis cinerea T4]
MGTSTSNPRRIWVTVTYVGLACRIANMRAKLSGPFSWMVKLLCNSEIDAHPNCTLKLFCVTQFGWLDCEESGIVGGCAISRLAVRTTSVIGASMSPGKSQTPNDYWG